MKIEDLVYSCLSSVSESKETHKFFDWQKFCYDFIEPSEAESNFKIIEKYVGKNKEGEIQKW